MDVAAWISEARIEVEHRRQESWGRLSPLVRELVSNSFPVLYGIRIVEDPLKVVFHERGNHEQIYILGGVSPENIVAIFVPRDKIEFVRRHLLPGMNVNIAPIESIIANKKSPGDFVREFFP